MARVRSLMWLILGVAFCLSSAGCGRSHPRTVNGKLVLPQSAKLAETDILTLTFLSAEKGGTTGIADVEQPDLAFTVQLPPGQYKVVFSVAPYAGEQKSEERTEAFEAGINDTYSADKSQLQFEVTTDLDQTITVDLAQGSVTKN